MRLSYRGIPLVCAGLLTLLAVGCGGRPVPVEGTVVHNGAPLDGATVVFTPVDTNEANEGQHQASARTDQAGHFNLRTGNANGAFTGKYKVTVSKMAYPKGKEPKNIMEAQMMPKHDLMPARYSRPEQTPLEVDISSGGSTDLKLSVEGE